ncbi:inositol polyphosphate 5-phosphatase OCRL-like isoform X3 [Dysidea avara]|uniref:inositol polyphosphate 5-phosphatase OCRL-like isoform X3 n=1 Tax=Dysidea avara TaxID=196820 RepID=UPI00332C06E3
MSEKRPSTPPLIVFDDEVGFEDNFVDDNNSSWPWSQIFQPSSDGRTQVANCEIDSFDPLKKNNGGIRSSSCSSDDILLSSRDSLPINDDQILSQQQPTNTGTAADQQMKASRSSELLRPTGAHLQEQLHYGGSSPLMLRHASSDPMLLDSSSGVQSIQWNNNITTKHRSSSYDNMLQQEQDDDKPTTPDSDPQHPSFYIDHSDDDLDDVTRAFTTSLPVVSNDKHRTLSQPPSILHRLSPKLSPKSSPKSSPKHSPELKSKHAGYHRSYHGLPKSSKLVDKSRAQANNPVLSRKKPRSITMLESSAADQEKSRAQLGRYFRPGVLMLKDVNPRMCIIQKKLKERENDFCFTKELKIYCCSWNVNGQPPTVSLGHLFEATEESKPDTHDCKPDIYAIGFQELDLSAEALVLNDSSREAEWRELVGHGLKSIDKRYYLVHAIRLVGILLIVYAKHALREYITDVETECTATGVMGVMGNKGGVAIRFNIHHTSMCFVNSHLAAHIVEVEKRNQDYNMICSKLHFGKGRNVYQIMDHDMIFWLGDLNYRLNTSAIMTAEVIRDYADKFQFHSLLEIDQLNIERQKQTVFVNYIEGPIDFKPTYKYDPNTDNWDTSDKSRAPAWCDRILWSGAGIKQIYYRSHHNYRLSDHKPVSALMNAEVRMVHPGKERSVFEEIVWELDKMENDTLPQVQLNQSEFHFPNIKFHESQLQVLIVENTGLRPVQVSFIAKLDKELRCKPWMSISPSSRVILPDQREFFELKVLVDYDTAPSLTMGQEKIEDILVLHLEGGKDFFVTISGNYLPSCFGLSLDLLVHLHTFVRDVTPTRLSEVKQELETISLDNRKRDKQMTTLPSLDIPKELWKLVDYLFGFGLDKENLFTDGGLRSEISAIRELLDTGGGMLWGNQSGLSILTMYDCYILGELDLFQCSSVQHS